MNQEDFRKLLQTPRAPSSGTPAVLGAGGARPKQAPPKTPKDSEFVKPDVPVKKKKLYKPPTTPTSKSEGPKYRDRAAERRTGKDELTTDDLLRQLNSADGSELDARVLYEQSKYLGGDTEHTHLVKGLDFALLSKVRNEMSRSEGGVAVKEETEEEAEDELDERLRTIEMGAGKAPGMAMKEEDRPEIDSPMVARMYNIVVEQRRPLDERYSRSNELFRPGRMCYVFELADPTTGWEEQDPFMIPTTVIRSKADVATWAAQEVGAWGEESAMVIEKISQVMGSVRRGERGAATVEEGKKRKKGKEKKEGKDMKEEKREMVVAMDDDEDIFADAGRDYKLDEEREEGEVDNKMEDTTTNDIEEEKPVKVDYFGGLHKHSDDNEDNDGNDAMDVDPSQTVDSLLAQAKAQSTSSFTATDPTAAATPTANDKVARRLAALDPSNDDDAADYNTFGLGTSALPTSFGDRRALRAYDPDDDDAADSAAGPTHSLVDQGTNRNKRAQLTRFDFETEEEWRRYKDTVEINPRAAYQFGVKMGDGRKTKQGQKRELSEKQKIDRDWQKIERIMEQKYGGAEGNGNGGGAGGKGPNRRERRAMQRDEGDEGANKRAKK